MISFEFAFVLLPSPLSTVFSLPLLIRVVLPWGKFKPMMRLFPELSDEVIESQTHGAIECRAGAAGMLNRTYNVSDSSYLG